MMQDCEIYDECRKPAQLCNSKCDLYKKAGYSLCRGCRDSLDGKAEISGLCKHCAKDTYEDRDYEIEDTD